MEPTTPTGTKGPMTAIIIIVLLLIAGALYFFAGGTSKEVSAADVAWRYDAVPVDKGAHPVTKVTLRVHDKEYDAGSYDGLCAQIGAAQLIEGEIAGVLCWYSGKGDEVGIFQEGRGYVVKHGEIEEPNEDSEGFRGNFIPLFNI